MVNQSSSKLIQVFYTHGQPKLIRVKYICGVLMHNLTQLTFYILLQENPDRAESLLLFSRANKNIFKRKVDQFLVSSCKSIH